MLVNLGDLPGLEGQRCAALEGELERILTERVPTYSSFGVYSLAEAMEELQGEAPPLDTLDVEGGTLLMLASKCGLLRVVKSFLFHGHPIEATDESGWNALTYAAVNGQASVVRALLLYGATVNGVTSTGMTALHYAAMNSSDDTWGDYTKISHLLIEAGAKVNALCHSNWSPLHECCNAHNSCIAFLLLRNGADFRLKTNENDTAMHLVCQDNYDAYGDDVLSILCALGADPCAANNDGRTPLHCATEQMGGWGLVEILYEFFPKLYLSPKDTIGNTPLHYVPEDRNSTFEWLLQNGADPNATNMDGDTPLHMFASHSDSVVYEDGHLSAGLLCIHKLLAKGVPLECKNKAGMTAMDEAVTAGLPSVVGLLENEVRSFLLRPWHRSAKI